MSNTESNSKGGGTNIFCCLSSMHLCSPVRNPLHNPSQSKHANTYRHRCISVCVCVGAQYIYVCSYMYKQNKSSDLSALKYLPLTYALENGTMDAPQDASNSLSLLPPRTALPMQAPTKRSRATGKPDYVGISVVVSHKYADSYTHDTTNTHTHTLHGQQQVGGAVTA